MRVLADAGRLVVAEDGPNVLVIDRLRRTYVDADGQIVAPLDQVRIERRMQIGSSSPKLVAVTPTGERVLMRGNPFGASIGNIDEVLNAVLWR